MVKRTKNGEVDYRTKSRKQCKCAGLYSKFTSKITSLQPKSKWVIITLAIVLIGSIILSIGKIILGSIDADYKTDNIAQVTEKSHDYQTLCTNGSFEEARAVQNRLYKEYTKALGRWRSGEWCEREARQKQECYRSATTFIFGQEICFIYYGDDSKRNERLIGLLVAIPTEGAPLAEGVHCGGMFYDNDAGVGEPLAIDHMVYQSWVRFYNDRCEQLLNLALANDNKILAQKVARLFKTEIDTRFQQDTIKGGDYRIATVSYNTARRDNAIEQSKK